MTDGAHYAVHEWPDGHFSTTCHVTHEAAQESANAMLATFAFLADHSVWVACDDDHALEAVVNVVDYLSGLGSDTIATGPNSGSDSATEA